MTSTARLSAEIPSKTDITLFWKDAIIPSENFSMKLKLGESVGETNRASLFIIGANKNDPKSVLTVLRSMRKTTSTNLNL